MTIRPTLSLILCLATAGCAALRQEPRCTDIIATNGGLLKFCQTSQNLTIYESGIDPTETGSVSVVNNPQALRALQSELPLRRDLRTSRRLVARSCSIAGNRYVTVSLADLKRIIRDAQPLVSASPEAGGAY